MCFAWVGSCYSRSRATQWQLPLCIMVVLQPRTQLREVSIMLGLGQELLLLERGNSVAAAALHDVGGGGGDACLLHRPTQGAAFHKAGGNGCSACWLVGRNFCAAFSCCAGWCTNMSLNGIP